MRNAINDHFSSIIDEPNLSVTSPKQIIFMNHIGQTYEKVTTILVSKLFNDFFQDKLAIADLFW